MGLHNKRLTVSIAFFLASVPAFPQGAFTGGGYGGPSVLSRGGNRAGYRGDNPVDFRYFVGVGATYDTGLLATFSESNTLVSNNLYGGTLEFGAYGAKVGRRSVLGLDYRGDYRRYNRRGFYDGSDHALSLGYSFEPSRRLNLSFQQTAGTSSRAFGGFTSPAFFNPELIGVPDSEMFDSRIYYLQSSAQLGYRLSGRTLIGIGGDGFAVRRESKSLVGLNGYRASARIERTVTRRASLGLVYDFTHFEYPRAFGASDIHGLAGQYRYRLSATTSFLLQGGVFRLETLGAQPVALSPEVAAILGRGQSIEAIYRINYWPQITASVEYRKRNHGMTLSYSRGVAPGNGVYLTSGQETGAFGYSYSGLRRWSLAGNAGYSRFNSLYQTVGRYTAFSGGGALSRNLGRNLQFAAQADVRQFQSGALDSRSGVSVRVTLMYSPGSGPLSLW